MIAFLLVVLPVLAVGFLLGAGAMALLLLRTEAVDRRTIARHRRARRALGPRPLP